MRMFNIFAGLCVLAAFGGCSASEPTSESQGDAVTTTTQVYVSNGKITSQRAIEKNAIGKVVGMTDFDGIGNVTHIANAVEIESAVLTVEDPCTGSDFQAYDQTGYVGNHLCLFISGGSTGDQVCLDLKTTLRQKSGCCFWLNWSTAIKSVKSQTQHGFLWQTSNTNPCDAPHFSCEENFTTSESESPVTTCAQGSESLTLIQ